MLHGLMSCSPFSCELAAEEEERHQNQRGSGEGKDVKSNKDSKDEYVCEERLEQKRRGKEQERGDCILTPTVLMSLVQQKSVVRIFKT